VAAVSALQAKSTKVAMPSFSDLPTELTTDILAAAISQHSNPSCILAVNRYFNDIGQFIIYTSLRFKSESQLVRFALRRRFRVYIHAHTHHTHHRLKDEDQEGDGAVTVTFSGGAGTLRHRGTSDFAAEALLPHFPRSISVRIPGGQGSGMIFRAIKHVFELCAEAVGTGILALDSLEFCLHSRTSDPTPWRIGETLCLVECVPSLLHFGPTQANSVPWEIVLPAHANFCGQDRILRTTFPQRFVPHPSVCPRCTDPGC